MERTREDVCMKRVYIAGAYSANNVIDVLKNIGRELLTGAAPMMIENLMSFIQKVPEAGE